MDVNGGDEVVGKLCFWGLYLGLERQGVEPNKAKKQETHSLRFNLRAGDGQATTLSSRKKTKKTQKKEEFWLRFCEYIHKIVGRNQTQNSDQP